MYVFYQRFLHRKHRSIRIYIIIIIIVAVVYCCYYYQNYYYFYYVFNGADHVTPYIVRSRSLPLPAAVFLTMSMTIIVIPFTFSSARLSFRFPFLYFTIFFAKYKFPWSDHSGRLFVIDRVTVGDRPSIVAAIRREIIDNFYRQCS